MEETKIWAVEGTSATPLNTTKQLEDEGIFEDILTSNPEMLEEGLQLVGRQTPTTGGPLDLLGVDGDGKLVVFELKRGMLNREAVAQTIDYASSLDAMDRDALHQHIEERSGNLGIQKIDNFANWFDTNKAESDQSLNSLTPPRMVLVGLGVDDTTERMVNYMARIGMDISLLTFYGFINNDGKTLLARNLEVDSANITTRQGASSRNEGRREFDNRVQSLPPEIQNLLSEAVNMFRSRLTRDQSTYTPARRNFNLDYSWYDESASTRIATLFLEIDEGMSSISVGFHPIAIVLAPDEFSRLDDNAIDFSKENAHGRRHQGDIDYEVKFPLNSLDDWESQKDTLTALTQEVCEAYDAAREQALSNQ